MNTERKQQLNAWIAEKVMGWKILPSGNWKDGNNPYNYPCEFNPVEDYGDAMMVLEKCAAKCNLSVEIGMFGDSSGRTYFINDTGAEIGTRLFADTLPLAIVLFAEKLFTETH